MKQSTDVANDMESARRTKVYVAVNVDFRADGVMLPQSLIWEDGHEYEIDKVTDIRPAPAMRAGG